MCNAVGVFKYATGGKIKWFPKSFESLNGLKLINPVNPNANTEGIIT